jgi:pilus assembly protein FimV
MKRGSPVRKLPARKLLAAIVAGALFLPETALTLGLGEIEVNSSLNQLLKADIELLSATPEEAETIIVKLASRKEFSRAGIDRPYLLNDLRFKSEVIDGVPHILVTSSTPIREPYLNFLVEIDWPNGHLLREYTVLLDPPVFMTQGASTSSAPAAQSDSSGFRPSSSGSSNVIPVATPGMAASPRPAAGAPVPKPQRQVASQTYIPAPYVQQQTTINQPPGSYRIKTGDTAWSLASAMRPDQSITVEQMMIAMLRSNPESFIDENINGLKRGYILRLPDYDQIDSIDPEEARALVREQAALWREYQQSHAGGQPVSAMPSDDMGGSSSMGEAAETAADQDEAFLEIVSAGTGTSTMSGKDPTEMSPQELRAELALARERVETERVEKEAMQQRIISLEENIAKMKGMLAIEDEQLSDIQALGMPAEGETGQTEPGQAEFLEPDMTGTTAAETEQSIAETDDLLAEQKLDNAISEETDIASQEELPADAMAEEGTKDEEGAVFLDETSTEGEPVATPEEAEPVQQEAAIDEVVQHDSRPPADPLTKLLSDPVLLAAAGGGLLLILALIALIIKRRKAATEEAPEMMLASDDLEAFADDIAAENKAAEEARDEAETADLDANQDGETAELEEREEERDLDSDSTMILDSVNDTIVAGETPPAEAEGDEPRDDVIAEADVYLAYGIYQQAEELLTQAITDNPDREDYRVKLAETHYASKNAEAFSRVAADIKQRAGDEMTPAWKKVMLMGQDLCADDPMFQGSLVGGLAVDSLAPKAPEMDFDLGLDEVPEAGDTATDQDSNLDDQPLDLPELDEDSVAEEDQPEETQTEPVAEIEFDLSDTGAVEEEEAAAEDEFSLDIDASELDIDIQEETEEAVTSEDDEIHDADDLDIDFGLDEEAETPATEVAEAKDEEIAIDLTDEADALDLGLDDEPAVETDTAETVEEAASFDLSEEDDFDLSSLDDVDEVSTKLDLARAYLDMGDHEGTRGILEEVLAEGNDDQKQEATELMAKLD